MTNVYADVDVSEQEDEGLESVSGSDVEQSPWYNADAIAIAVLTWRMSIELSLFGIASRPSLHVVKRSGR